jgi:hypothetical protein
MHETVATNLPRNSRGDWLRRCWIIERFGMAKASAMIEKDELKNRSPRNGFHHYSSEILIPPVCAPFAVSMTTGNFAPWVLEFYLKHGTLIGRS